jgi:hypothetical protein
VSASQARWTVRRLDELAVEVGEALAREHPGEGPAVLAVDGRSASGKSTLARRLVDLVPGAALVHGDDLAWHDSVVDWDHLLRDGVLAPLRAGRAVDFRPPAWRDRGRPGSVRVPAGADPLVIEGVGAGRRSLSADVTLVLWVETPEPVRWARDEHRVQVGEATREVQRSWFVEEDAHLRADAPWSRARWVVSGDPQLPLDPEHEVCVLA